MLAGEAHFQVIKRSMNVCLAQGEQLGNEVYIVFCHDVSSSKKKAIQCHPVFLSKEILAPIGEPTRPYIQNRVDPFCL
jgi:hypothetical protein